MSKVDKSRNRTHINILFKISTTQVLLSGYLLAGTFATLHIFFIPYIYHFIIKLNKLICVR